MNINLNNQYNLINNNLNINIINTSIGKIITIDNFLKNPYIFYNFYYNNNLINIPYNKHIYNPYPGKQFNLNETLSNELNNFTDKYIKNFLNLNYLNNIKNSNYYFRIINKKNSQLHFENILPHNHVSFNNKYYLKGISSCIYLCNKNKKSSGTSFYKENIKVRGELLNKRIKYNKTVPIINNDVFNYNKYKSESEYLKKLILNPRYNADTENILYTKVFSVDSKFNRCVFFSNDIFHNFDLNHNYYNNINDMDHKRLTIIGITYYDNIFKINNQNYLFDY